MDVRRVALNLFFVYLNKWQCHQLFWDEKNIVTLNCNVFVWLLDLGFRQDNNINISWFSAEV